MMQESICSRCNKERIIYSNKYCRPCYIYFWKKTDSGKLIETKYRMTEKRKIANQRNLKKFYERFMTAIKMYLKLTLLPFLH